MFQVALLPAQAHLEGMTSVMPTSKASTMQDQARREVRKLRLLAASSDRLLLRLKGPDGHLAPSSSDLRRSKPSGRRQQQQQCQGIS